MGIVVREIKFRVWAKYGEMLHNVQNHIGNDKWAFGNMLYSDDFVIMQYTGLKDKNGVEVYEGDILALDNESERGSYHIYKIEYNADKARFVGVDDDEISCMPSIVNHHDGAGRYMVIGNIYENPELLEQSK